MPNGILMTQEMGNCSKWLPRERALNCAGEQSKHGISMGDLNDHLAGMSHVYMRFPHVHSREEWPIGTALEGGVTKVQFV